MPYLMPSVPSLDTAPGPDTALPALRGLGRLADLQPVIAIDTREQVALKFTRLPSVERSLFTGDYSICGLEDSFAVERKSIEDLVGCCMNSNRARFERELRRLRGFRFKCLLVVGSRQDIAAGRYYSRITPKAVLATLGAFEIRYDLPIVFAETVESAALQVERWAFWFCREVVENANDLLRGCEKPSSVAIVKTQA
jgi:ERCC4-type nuclease